MGAVLAVPLVAWVNDRLGGVMLLVALVLLWWRNPWPKAGRVVASVVAAALLGAVLPDQPATTPARAEGAADAKPTLRPYRAPTPFRTPEPTTPTVPDFTGDSLDVAFPRSRRLGLTVTCHDASDQKPDFSRTGARAARAVPVARRAVPAATAGAAAGSPAGAEAPGSVPP